MGKRHCVCKKEPCECNNGWGRFDSEAELLAAIDAEIGQTHQRQRWGNGHNDCQAVQWLVGESLSIEEIAETLGMSVSRVRGICRDLGIDNKQEGIHV